MTPEQELQHAREAQRFMDEPLFKEAREDIYGRIRSHRLAAATTDTQLHSKLILLEQVADQFFRYFEQKAQTGKWAQEHLDQQERQHKGLKERLAAYASFGRNAL